MASATTGNFTVNLAAGSAAADKYTMTLNYSYSHSAANNKTTLTIKGTIKSNNSSYTSYKSSSTNTVQVRYNNSSGTYVLSQSPTTAYDCRNLGSTQIFSYSVEVPHDASGNRTVWVSWYFNGNQASWNPTGTVTGTITFPQSSYTVTYDANGGSGAPSSQTKTYGTALTLSSTIPTKNGYLFMGWGTSSTATASYQAGSPYTNNAAITLYAVWCVASLIGMNFTIPSNYTVTNNSKGEAVFTNITIPFTLTTTSENKNMNLLYYVYYDNGTLVGTGSVKTVTAGTTSSSFTLSSSDIISHLKATLDPTTIKLVIHSYTGSEVNETFASYNLSIPINGYYASITRIPIGYRESDDTVYAKVCVQYPECFTVNIATCVPTLYFNDVQLSESPISSTIDGNIATYVYEIPRSSTFGEAYLKATFNDGVFMSSRQIRIAASTSEQVIKLFKNGTVQAFEFIEIDNGSFGLTNSGQIQAYELVET